MNITYIKELHDSINNSNEEFIKEQYRLDHAMSASKLSLYYAHGNTEKNEINYRAYKTEEKSALNLDSKAVKGVNLANNALQAAKQSLVDSSKATSNVSTAAANMQIAANAITKLSSDVAGILAVANAADYGSGIQESVEGSYDKIKKAAKQAEEVSLISLQATIEAAQSTASTVVTDAEMTLASITSFQKSTAARYSSVAEKVVASNESLTAARKIEKASSATFDIATKQDQAIKTTRKLINKVSNNNLLLMETIDMLDTIPASSEIKKASLSSDYVGPGESYTIQYNKFDDEENIQSYRLIMVKHDAAEAFDISIAKDLDAGTYCQIQPTGYSTYSRRFYLLGTEQALIVNPPSGSKGANKGVTKDIDHANVRGIAVDYKGKPIERGEHYVAFIYAAYTDVFQKKINSTDGYLSLPSDELILQKSLKETPQPEVFQPYFDSRDFEIKFEVDLNDYDPELMEYRIMMIETQNVEANKINSKIRDAVEKLLKAEYNYNIQKQKLAELMDGLNGLEIQFNSFQTNILKLQDQLAALNKKLKNYNDENPAPPALLQQQEDLENQLAVLQKKIKQNTTGQEQLESLIYTEKTGQKAIVETAKTDYQNASDNEKKLSKKKISDFILDTDLMDVVSPANYYVATPFKWDKTTAEILFVEAKEKLKLSEVRAEGSIIALFENTERIIAAKDAVSEAQEKVVKAQIAFNEKEKALDAVELGALKPKKKKTETDGDEEGSKEPSSSTKLEQAIKALREARVALQTAENNLHKAEIELEAAHDNEKETTENLKSIFSNYIKARFEKDRAERIFNLAKAEAKKKEGNDTPQKILFYTQLGEDATDNYGEPLQFNQEDMLKYAMELIQQDDFLDKEKRIEHLHNNLTKENLQKKVKKSDDTISYQAVVLTAIKTGNTEEVNQYKENYSKYSTAHSLYGIVE